MTDSWLIYCRHNNAIALVAPTNGANLDHRHASLILRRLRQRYPNVKFWPQQDTPTVPKPHYTVPWQQLRDTLPTPPVAHFRRRRD